MTSVQTRLAIGDFSRASHLSIKMLRYYHEVGLLEPAEVDAESGYRRYATEQIATAQIIRRFRELDMPLEEIQAVLDANDVATRNQLVAAHLARLESNLARVQGAVAALRNLLERPNTSAAIAHQRVPATTAAAISQVIAIGDAVVWLQGALGELNATLAAQHIARVGAPGGMYSTELFTEEIGRATVFVACSPAPRPMGRVSTLEIPAVDLATIVHSGPYAGMETAYGALATHVAQHAVAMPGPVREYYLVGPADTADETTWRTEVGWPIFQMAAQESSLSRTGAAPVQPRTQATWRSIRPFRVDVRSAAVPHIEQSGRGQHANRFSNGRAADAAGRGIVV